MPIEQVVAALRRDPGRTAVLLDFDGTLAPIVEDPAAARPLPEVGPLLAAASRAYATVAVISGRPVSHLAAHLEPGPTLVGLYGLEVVRDGRVVPDEEAERWRGAVATAVGAARAELPPEVGVEDKGLSLTLHVRRHPHLAPVVEGWAEARAEATGLELRPARMSVELHPPVAVDKGSVVESLLAASDVDVACFVGDDVGDLPAFAAIERFRQGGGEGHRIVVASSESASEVLDVADAVLDGPPAVAGLLRSLVA